MEKEKEKKTVKIRTRIGKILTVTISEMTDTQVIGVDKFGTPVIISRIDIEEMLPYAGAPQ